MRKLLPLLLVFMLVLAACGGDDDDDDGSDGDSGGAGDIENCDDVGQAFLDEMQVLLDELSDASIEDLSGEESPEAVTNFENSIEEIGALGDELGCSEEDLTTFLQENVDDLEADGPVPELLLQTIQQGIESGEFFDDIPE